MNTHHVVYSISYSLLATDAMASTQVEEGIPENSIFNQVLYAFENPSTESIPIYGAIGIAGIMVLYVLFSCFQKMNRNKVVESTYQLEDLINEKNYLCKDNEEFFKQLD